MMEVKIQLAPDVRSLNRWLDKRYGAFAMQVRWAMWETQEAILYFLQKKSIEYATQEYYIKPSAVKKAIRVQNYAKGGRYIVSGQRQLLHHYKINPTKPKKKPVMLQGAVRKAGGLKPLGQAFLMSTGTGKYIAMRRTGSARFPIKPLVGPAIPQILEGYYDRELRDAAKSLFKTIFLSSLHNALKQPALEKDTMWLNSADFHTRARSPALREGKSFSGLTSPQRMETYSRAASILSEWGSIPD